MNRKQQVAETEALKQRIKELIAEKGDLFARVEAEEEYITNNLQRKLNALQQEKITLESELEKEKEFLVNKLQRQLSDMMQKSTPGQSTEDLSILELQTKNAEF